MDDRAPSMLKPTLIGGITLSPTEDGPKKELYLVIETSIVKQR